METLELLKKNGFEVAPYKVVKTLNEAIDYCKNIGYPVVLKLPIEEHKTDIGAVVLDNYTDKMVESAFHYLKQKFNAENIMIQKQIKEGIEMYAGIKDDEQFGKVIIIGTGGIYVELFKDITSRLCPVNKKDAEQMIEEIKIGKLLSYRGKNINKNALVNFIVKLSNFALKKDFKEIDINPFKIKDKAIIIDARMVK
jgi:succinyl-CoA synthetase beta subunit